MLISSKGKYSLEGRPPPSEIKPGVFKNLAAALRELLFLVLASVVRRSVCSQPMVSPMKRQGKLRACGRRPLTIKPFRLGLMQVRRPSLEGIHIRDSSHTGDELPRCNASLGNILDGQTIRNGKGARVGFRQHLDCRGRCHGRMYVIVCQFNKRYATLVARPLQSNGRKRCHKEIRRRCITKSNKSVGCRGTEQVRSKSVNA